MLYMECRAVCSMWNEGQCALCGMKGSVLYMECRAVCSMWNEGQCALCGM